MTPFLSVLSGLLRILSAILGKWPLVLLALFFLSPIGPHLRWEYSYHDTPAGRIYLSCDYVGSRGVIAQVLNGPDCPLFIIFDARRR